MDSPIVVSVVDLAWHNKKNKGGEDYHYAKIPRFPRALTTWPIVYESQVAVSLAISDVLAAKVDAAIAVVGCTIGVVL